MTVAALTAGAVALLRDRTASDASYPPPWPVEVAQRALQAQQRHAAAAEGLAPDFVALVAALEETEEQGAKDAPTKAREVTRAAPRVARDLGEDGWRKLTNLLAMRAVERLKPVPKGAFYERVLQPTAVIDPQGQGPPGWEALAATLHRVRLLRMALGPGDDKEAIPLSDDEKLLYYRWKVERATRSRRTVRLDALRQVILLDPSYPAAEAEAHIIRKE